MRLDDYIKKHDLKPWRTHPNPAGAYTGVWTSEIFTQRDVRQDKRPFPLDDRFEILANDSKTHFVSRNVTSNQFRIIYYEMVLTTSEWHPIDMNFEMEPL